MRKNALAAIAIIAAIALVGAGVWAIINFPIAHLGKPETITIGMEPNQVNSLIIIADEKGFFDSNGLNVTIKEYPSGAAAVNGLLAGDVNIATATEFVAVGNVLSHWPLLTFATIDRFQQIYLIGRKDRGIENISDLKGKIIGVPKKTAAEFYLGRFLNLHGMSMQDVTLVDIKPTQSSDSLINGTIDAVVIWQPYVGIIEKQIGNSTVIWPAQSEQAAYCSAISTDNWTAQHPLSIKRFLRSLALAEKYSIDRPDAAKAIVQKRLHYDDAFITAIWPNHQFTLSLDQSLVSAMEDEARWMINNNLTTEKTTPDFTEYIYTKGLEEVKPDSVNIW